MFFVNSDLKKEGNSTRTLSDVVNDSSIKVAYGVLSLRDFYKMVRHVGNSSKIFIPKVQRGLVWKGDKKSTFIDNCIVGKDGITEPMPNIFLFCNAETKHIQLFDGLQRTSAILSHFKTEQMISDEYNVMIPAALFKGTRIEAEQLFRNINDKGVKLNDFEKLASFGGTKEVYIEAQSKTFKKQFEDFVEMVIKQYKNIGLKSSSKENSTIYELMNYAIYSFSRKSNAADLFCHDIYKDFFNEWAYQIVYSTCTKNESKAYSRKNMLNEKENILDHFGEKIEYNYETKTFNEDKLDKYISDINEAFKRTRNTIRDLFDRNINSPGIKERINTKLALQSKALVGAVISTFYLSPDKYSNSYIKKWYILQLIKNRTRSNTNMIIDELLSISDTEKDIDRQCRNHIKNFVENEKISITTYTKKLWMLFYIYFDEITKTALDTTFEIDHIIPQALLKKHKIINIDNIGNLMLIKKQINRTKSDKPLSEFVKDSPFEKEIKQCISVYSEKKNVYDSLISVIADIHRDIENEKENIQEDFNYFLRKRRDAIANYLEKETK